MSQERDAAAVKRRLRAILEETNKFLPPIPEEDLAFLDASASPAATPASGPPAAARQPSSSQAVEPDELGFLPDDSDLHPDKRRGGQPRNLNALKHGFYSKTLTPERQLALKEAALSNDLEAEISLLRVKFRELAAAENTNPDLILKTARTLARLISVQYRVARLRRFRDINERPHSNY